MIKEKYPIFKNFINSYFIENKLRYFTDKSLDFSTITLDCRTNNYIESYNYYLKTQLGKKRKYK